MAAAEAAWVRIALKDSAVVAGMRMTVADLAQVEASDARLQAMVAQLELANAPAVGSIERYGREEIQRALRSRVPGLPPIAWEGAHDTRVIRAEQAADTNAIARIAIEALEQALAGRFAELNVTLQGQLAPIALPLGIVRYQPRVIPSARFLAHRVVQIDAYVDDRFIRTIAVPLHVHALQEVLAVRQATPSGSSLSVKDVVPMRMDADQVPEDVIGIGDVAADLRVRHPLQAGQVVVRRAVGQPLAVASGEAVKLIAVAGSVVVEARAIAQQDGDIGQIVLVRAEKSTAAVPARVTGVGVVQVSGG